MIDPVRYAAALGEAGLAAYRQAIARRDGERSFAVRWARERLTVLDEDTQAIIALLGGDLSSPHQFIRVVRRWLSWAATRTFFGGRFAGSPKPGAGRSPGSTTLPARCKSAARLVWRSSRCAASSTSGWPPAAPIARYAAQPTLCTPGSWSVTPLARCCVSATVANSSTRCCKTATLTAHGRPPPRDPAWDPGTARRARLAEAREPTRSDQALAWYLQLADEELLQTGRPAYPRAASILKRARRAAQAAGQSATFATALADLRERHHRRPTLIAC